MFKEKIKLISIVLCISLLSLLLVACNGKDSSKGGDASASIADESSVFSSEGLDDGEDADFSDSSDELSEDDVSDDGKGDISDISDASQTVDESSEDSNSDDISDDTSDNVSDDSSEDTFVDELDYTLEEFVQKYGELDFIKAISNLDKKYSDTVNIALKTEVDLGKGNSMEMNMELSLDARGEEIKVLANIEATVSGTPYMSQKFLSVGDKAYMIDDASKTYCVQSRESSDTEPGVDINFGDVDKVETKNELVNGEIYVADWVYVSGGKIGFYTKNGELKYLTVISGDTSGLEMLIELDVSDDISDASFEIPKGYVLVDADSFIEGPLF